MIIAFIAACGAKGFNDTACVQAYATLEISDFAPHFSLRAYHDLKLRTAEL